MLLQPPQPRREPEPDGTKLALRAATLGIVALLLFGVLVFRLWALQVLRSAEYVAQANVQNTREIPIPPQRGDIVDRNGVTLVENTSAVVLQVDPSTISRSIDCSSMGNEAATCSTLMAAIPVGAVPRCRQLPQQPRCFELSRLARVLKTPEREVWRTYERPLLNGDKGARYVINAGPPVALGSAKDAQVAFVLERRDHYPGVSFLRTYKRSYTPWPALGKILGYVGAITPDELKDPQFKDLPLNATVGQDGVEYTYDKILRGTPGELNQSFDASGHAIGQPYMVTAAADRPAAQADGGREAAAGGDQGDLRRHQHRPHGRRGERSKGAIVAMDPKTGGILAMASVPSYRSNIYGSTKLYKEALRAGALNDEAINGLFAPGSTFKPFTAAAAWWRGFIGPGSTRDCAGSFERPGERQHTVFKLGHGQQRDDRAVQGARDLVRHLLLPARRPVLRQTYLHRHGHVPELIRSSASASRRRSTSAGGRRARSRPAVAQAERPQPVDRPRLGAGLRHPDGDRPGLPARLAAPAAVAYSALANGGTLVTPHCRSSRRPRRDGTGRRQLTLQAAARPHLPPEFLAEIETGLYGATHAGDGTSTRRSAASSRPSTARRAPPRCAPGSDRRLVGGLGEQDGHPQIVVVAMIENGGHGGVSAAPVAREVLAAYFHSEYRIPEWPRAPTSSADAPLPPPPRPPDARDRARDLGVRAVDHEERDPERHPGNRVLLNRSSSTSRSAWWACSSWPRSRRAWMRRVHWPLYVFVLVSVAAVLAAGHTVHGPPAGSPSPGSSSSRRSSQAAPDRRPRRAAGVAPRHQLAGRLTLLALGYMGVPALLVFLRARLRHGAGATPRC